MTLLRRRPRELYRVYSEEEYLGGAGTQLGGVAEWDAVEPELAELGSAGEHRLRCAAGVAVLACVVGAAGVLVCLNLARTHGGDAPGRGSLIAATRSARVADSALVADDARSQVQSPRPAAVGPLETARSRVSARSGRSREAGPATRRSDRLPARSPAPRHAGVVVLADDAHRRLSSSETAPAAPVSATAPAPAPVSASAPAESASQAAGATSAAVVTAPARRAPETQAEFGFER
jgi:hypothetical protein